MRKYIFIIVTVILIMSLNSLYSQDCDMTGDADCSLGIDIIDALIIAQQYVGLEPTDACSWNMDVDYSSTIDIIDALIVAQYYVGLSGIPACPSKQDRHDILYPQITQDIEDYYLLQIGNGNMIDLSIPGDLIQEDVISAMNTEGFIPSGGTNNISVACFEDADMILVHDGICAYGYFRHSGTFAKQECAFISAQPGEGVKWEYPDFYRDNFHEACGVSVKYDKSDRNTITSDIMSELKTIESRYTYYFIGPITSYSYNDDWWYCSKLPWIGWYKETKERDSNNPIDISWKTGEYFKICIPDSLYHAKDTIVFTRSY